MPTRPFVVTTDDAVHRTATAELTGAGWTIGVDVLDVTVPDAEAARRAVLAAVSGTGLLVRATASRAVVDDLVEDLGRLGPVVVADARTSVDLETDTWRLLHALARGATVAVAARALHLSTRTANRRVTEARTVLGAPTRAHLVRAVTAPGRIRPVPQD